jgi:hypothetical protein
MTSPRTLITAILAISPLACSSPPPSSPSSHQALDEQRFAELTAAAEWQMRQFQQQPRSNRSYPKLVHPQPVEDPLHAGRDLEH